MTNKGYLDKLLSLCTPQQKDLYKRMYPNGPAPAQIKWAITQVENTLNGLNCSNQELKDVKANASVAAYEFEEEIIKLKRELAHVYSDLEGANSLVKRLENPVNFNNNILQEELRLLYALQAAGVDNWEGYDHAQEIMEDV